MIVFVGTVDDKRTREMSFKRNQGSRCPRHISRHEDRHIVRNAHVHLTASSATIKVHVAPSLGALVSSRTIRMCLTE
ncbi:hypothetical protein TNCV_458431 [Trichonephila clavipes]|nr:hypothetical protein TNCV_458431 [Trichonephila clavipes]